MNGEGRNQPAVSGTNGWILAKITSLWILIPVILALAVFALYARKKQMESPQHMGIIQAGRLRISLRGTVLALLAVYLLIYVQLTFAYRRTTMQAQINLTPFWSYGEAFQLIPPKIRRLGLARQILLNILLTMPLGLLLPLLFYKAKHPYLLTMGTVLILTLSTEVLQYLTRRGLCELDDLVNNLLGGILGMAVIVCGTGMIRMKRKHHEVQ